MNWFDRFFKWFASIWPSVEEALSKQTNDNPMEPAPNPWKPAMTPTPVPPQPPSVDMLLPWNTTSSLSHVNFHNVRVLCDLEGLSVELKNELCATVWGESDFNTHAINRNYAFTPAGVRYVASTDNGICQWNDVYHGKEITADEATNNPEKAVRLMCKYFLLGRQNQWCAHSNGRYKLFMSKSL